MGAKDVLLDINFQRWPTRHLLILSQAQRTRPMQHVIIIIHWFNIVNARLNIKVWHYNINIFSTIGYYYEKWDPTIQSKKNPKKLSRKLRSTDNRPRRGKLLPEHIDLGLRLTVGEDVIQKPFLESKHGDGKFPEMQPHTEAAPNPYYPSAPGSPGKDFDRVLPIACLI